jgi:hypothetical protein
VFLYLYGDCMNTSISFSKKKTPSMLPIAVLIAFWGQRPKWAHTDASQKAHAGFRAQQKRR